MLQRLCLQYNEITRKSGGEAESQGDTTITVGTKALTLTPIMPASPESPRAVPKSFNTLPPSLQAILCLPELEDTPEEKDPSLISLFSLPPDPRITLTLFHPL